ncbi:MAG: esterase [Pricia sp.]|nr:esterase [Pricia sp.]
MDHLEKHIDYKSTNTYSTLNTLTDKTKNVWIVFHGIGYLSRYFLKYFDALSSDENFVIAPQAPAKYYLTNEYRHVGASWLTKENTVLETQNVIAYLDAILHNEKIPPRCDLIIFGFSQGVSIATRWIAQRQLNCRQLILYAGGIPDEFEPSDFEFLKHNETQVTAIIGNNDEYISENRKKTEFEKLQTLFQGNAKQIIFEGGHEVRKDIIKQLVQ